MSIVRIRRIKRDALNNTAVTMEPTDSAPVMKDDRSDGGKMARKSFGFPHKKSTEKRRMQVETKQLKSIRLTKVSSQNTARLSMESKRCYHVPHKGRIFSSSAG